MKTLSQEHQEWRKRMRALTQELKDNPHRKEPDSGKDGHFKHGMFIEKSKDVKPL